MADKNKKQSNFKPNWDEFKKVSEELTVKIERMAKNKEV